MQTEKLELTGQMVLTCFLLPQIHQIQENKISPPQNITVPKRHIAFTEPGIPKEPPIKLTRAPTPYPKDFQRFQRSLSNQLRKNRDGSSSGSNISSDPNIAHMKDAKLTPVKDQMDSITNPDDLYIKNTMYGTYNNMHQKIIQTNDNHNTRKNLSIELEKQYTYAHNSDNNLDNYCSNYNDKISIDSSDQSKISLELQESCAIIQGPKEPPPYHIAAAYSKNAKFFNRIDDPLDKNSPVEKPKNFTKELPQNISMPQPLHLSKQKGEVDEHFLKELNKRLLNTSDQKNERKLINENRNDDNFYKATNYRCVGVNCDYSEANSNDIPNTHRVPKLVRVTLNPCCYVLGFTVTYNENVRTIYYYFNVL